MRAPGVTQGIFVMESILDQLADTIGMDVNTLRAANFYDAVWRRHQIPFPTVRVAAAAGPVQLHDDPEGCRRVQCRESLAQERHRYHPSQVRRCVAAPSTRVTQWGTVVRVGGEGSSRSFLKCVFVVRVSIRYAMSLSLAHASAFVRVYSSDGTIEVSTSECHSYATPTTSVLLVPFIHALESHVVLSSHLTQRISARVWSPCTRLDLPSPIMPPRVSLVTGHCAHFPDAVSPIISLPNALLTGHRVRYPPSPPMMCSPMYPRQAASSWVRACMFFSTLLA